MKRTLNLVEIKKILLVPMVVPLRERAPLSLFKNNRCEILAQILIQINN